MIDTSPKRLSHDLEPSSLDGALACARCRRPFGRRATRTHVLHDLATLDQRTALAGLTALRKVERSARVATRPRATSTHALRDVAALFMGYEPASDGRKRIRICVVDTMLQTGGAEWFAAQLAMTANPEVFELVFVTYNSNDSAIAQRLVAHGFRVLSASAWRRGSFDYSEWLDEELFELLDRLNPDVVFFSSQYLFEQLRHDRLERFSVVVRISNFHADELEASDFAAASTVVCCTDEQYDVVKETWPDKAVLIKTGVDTELFRSLTTSEKEELKRAYGLEDKQVVLFVGRLGSPLKRLNVFQEVVRRIKAQRHDVAVVVVGYFSKHDGADAEGFRRFVETEGILWRDDVPPWGMPAFFQMADVLLSTSAEYEGLSNTVLQALAAGVVPVTTASAGMHELIEPGHTGYVTDDFGAEAIAAELCRALESHPATRQRLRRNGRRKVEERFSFAECAAEYQRAFLACYRAQPPVVCITDGSFGTGGAEWLAAQLILNSEPRDVRFELVLHRTGSPLAGWLADRGVIVHAAPARMHYDTWRSEGTAEAFRTVRPAVVMPCTITSWPRHDPFYRLLIISQNAADARKLKAADYERADFILCVSQEVMHHLDPRYRWKMSVLRNSIDVELFSPQSRPRREVREQLGIPHDARVVLWAGRMHEPHKRLDVLMSVVDATAEEDTHFLVVGYFRDDEQEGIAAWRAFLEVHPNVSWVSSAAPWEMPRYYSAADVYLSTSGFEPADFEGLSLTSVQALAAQLPIVTTTSGGQQEVVDDGINGRLVANGDVEALTAALREMLRLDARPLRDLQAANREKALARFNIREHARVYARIARLLKNNVGPALAADPELPAPVYNFSDADQSSAQEIRRASSFIHFTWPLIRASNETDATDPRDTATDPRDLERLASGVKSGGQLVLRDLGPDYADDGARTDQYSAARIGALLDYLESSFQLWSACERRGSDLVLKKR